MNNNSLLLKLHIIVARDKTKNKNMKQGILKGISGVTVLGLLIFLMAPILFIKKAEAADLAEAYVRIDRLKRNTATSGMVCAKAATIGVEDDIQITFPTGFDVNTTEANWVVNDDNLPNGSTFWIGMTDGVTDADDVTGQVVTFPSGNMVVGTLYCFNFSGTNTLTTKDAAENDQVGIITTRVATVPLDTAEYALSTITDDQIVITATVPPIFTFDLSDNTDTFTTNLSPTSIVSTSGSNTVSISTNASNGWVAWVKSANAGLDSASAGASIATAGDPDDNTPEDLDSVTGYVLDVNITTDSGTGDGTVTQASNWGAEYAGADTTEGGSLATTFRPIAASDGTTDGDVLTLIERTKIIAVQQAATDYTDTLTVIAAGRF